MATGGATLNKITHNGLFPDYCSKGDFLTWYWSNNIWVRAMDKVNWNTTYPITPTNLLLNYMRCHKTKTIFKVRLK